MCQCEYCNREFIPRKKKGCRVCSSCDTTKRRWESRKELLEMMGSVCSNCGFTGNPASLQFHHTDPSNKKYSLYSKNLLRADRYEEAKKCIILCANCHIAEHTNQELLKKLGVLP
jgi:hypothetical protein